MANQYNSAQQIVSDTSSNDSLSPDTSTGLDNIQAAGWREAAAIAWKVLTGEISIADALRGTTDTIRAGRELVSEINSVIDDVQGPYRDLTPGSREQLKEQFSSLIDATKDHIRNREAWNNSRNVAARENNLLLVRESAGRMAQAYQNLSNILERQTDTPRMRDSSTRPEILRDIETYRGTAQDLWRYPTQERTPADIQIKVENVSPYDIVQNHNVRNYIQTELNEGRSIAEITEDLQEQTGLGEEVAATVVVDVQQDLIQSQLTQQSLQEA